jgi:hypothetical protein
MLLWTQPWIGTFNADEMRHMDYMRNLGDVGTDGGFACSYQPTESDCIFAEVSVGTVHNFYRKRENKNRRYFRWNDHLYTKKVSTTILRIPLFLEIR